MQGIILLFTKYPRPGKAKTRLIPAVGAHQAANIQRHMTKIIADKVKEFTSTCSCKTAIYHDGGSTTEMSEWLGASHSFFPQQAGDLGKRMSSAIAKHQKTHASVLLIGSDCPDISTAIFKEAFTALTQKQIVIGPAFDGGYYLIGMRNDVSKEMRESLFQGIEWGTESVLQQTLDKIQQLRLSYHLLEKLHDIDTPEDLRYLNYHPDAE